MNYYQYGVDIWENDMIVNDEFDSDQLDEDESYSWASGITDPQESCTANWRGWRNNGDNRQPMQQQQQQSAQKGNSRILYESQISTQSNTNDTVLKLVDICARYIALNMPFELVESFTQPVPEDLQLKITFASFPDSVEDIRLYSCLANGNAEEYLKGEQLFNNKNVRNILQIGFHLSATVFPLCNPGANKNLNVNVAVVCDRKRITSCHCTCSKVNSWCSHIVAVCLARIVEPQFVELRAPVSESLSKLQRDQLQKFAQYLISELPQQILPTAQKLLDELLKSNESSINLLSGAPDPTAGSSANEISVWCLDEALLQENIHKTLSKFVVPSPHVVSDIDYLAHSSSAASAEYTSLLRPLRGREPEGMWNLISILKELFRKRDKNSVPLLRIITLECINLDLIVNLWFNIKVSPLYNERGAFNQRQHNHHHTPPVHQACATLLDEIVSLWRIACLNPIYSIEDKISYREILTCWQKQIYEKIRKYCLSTDKHHLANRVDPDLFPAFLPAIDACQMNWNFYDFNSSITFKRTCIDNLPPSQHPSSSLNNGIVPNDDLIKGEETPPAAAPVKSGSSSSEGFHEDNIKLLGKQSSELLDETTADFVFNESVVTPPSIIVTPEIVLVISSNNTVNLSLNTPEHKRLELLFSRCEALYAHGYREQSCTLANILAEYLLSSYNIEKLVDDFISCKNSNCSTAAADSTNKMMIKFITNIQSSILWRTVLLATVLLENNSNRDSYQLAFRLGVLSLEIPRQPASTKSLEVRLFNQEQDLVYLLKRIPIADTELSILRDRARKIKDQLGSNINYNKCKCNNLNYLPIVLSSFIFDVLSNDKNANCSDESIGFDAAVASLGYKPNVDETHHAIYCEGIRRQKGDLAINLLLTYKDDQTRLLKIMDKILDKEIHVLFKSPTNPFQPNLKRIQQNNLQQHQSSPVVVPKPINEHRSVLNTNKQQLPPTSSIISTTIETAPPPAAAATCNQLTTPVSKNLKYSTSAAMDSLSSGWDESESEGGPNQNPKLLETKHRWLNLNKQNNTINNNNKKGGCQSSFDSSAPETTSSDNSPTINRKSNNWQQPVAASTITTSSEPPPIIKNDGKDDNESDKDSGQSLSSVHNRIKSPPPLPPTGSIVDEEEMKLKGVNMTTTNWVDGTFNETTAAPVETKILNELFSSMLTTNPNDFPDLINQLTSTASAATIPAVFSNKKNRSNQGKNKTPVYPNQPSEALAHFMFDFSKTLLSKAGGPISTAIFLNQNNNGPHRNLHICAFIIALYALGLQNCVQTNWLSRTYSSHVSWINGQASDIGYAAICILIECWVDRLTPSECVSLADRVSRGRDTMAVKAAAELALSSLKYSHSLTLQEIQRALVQCKEQNNDMLQRACLIVETSVREGNNINLADVLFEVAKRWDELYIESMRANGQNQQQNELIIDPTSPSCLQQQQQQQAAVVAAAAVAVSNNYIQQQSPMMDPMVHPQFSYIQQPTPQTAPFAFQVQTLPFPQYLPPPQSSPGMQNTGQMHVAQNMFIPHMYTAYGTIVSTPNLPPPQNLYAPQNNSNHHPYPIPQMNVYPANVNNNYLFQNQIAQMMSNPNTQIPIQHQQQKPQEIDSVSMKYFLSAFRVGMLGLEALPRRVDSSHQIKYLRSPSYGENVKWLWGVSVKLGINSLQQFCQTAANVIQNPFLIQELAFDSANFLCRNNPVHFTHALRSPMLNVLVQRCLNSYFRCCVQKMHHLTPNDHEDFINMVVTARNAFYYSGNMSSFSELLQNLKKSKACKKDLWSKIYNALANTSTNISSNF